MRQNVAKSVAFEIDEKNFAALIVALAPQTRAESGIFPRNVFAIAVFAAISLDDWTAALPSKMQQVKRKKFFTQVLRLCNNRPVVSVRAEPFGFRIDDHSTANAKGEKGSDAEFHSAPRACID